MKALPRIALTLFALLLATAALFAQKKTRPPLAAGPDGFVRCATVEQDALRRASDPRLGSLEDFEKWLAPRVRAYEEQAARKRGAIVVVTIPVVVHVLHNGEPVGSAPNITDAQAISQIQVMNEDFRRILGSRGYNSHPDGADVELEFCMAQQDPFGNATTGVNHVNIQQDGATMDQLETTIKASTIWDPSRYMNMWSVKFATPDDNLLGYAQFPEGSGLDGMPTGSENATTDGVAIRYQSFGTSELNDGTFILDAPYDLGRTATHEVGHWVGLRHIWGDGLGCNLGVAPPGCSCTETDYCDDTPASDQANYGCPEGKISPCDLPNPPSLDMIENYMDYSDDPCMNIFTQGQKARVQAVMANSPRRMELVNSPGCLPPQPFITFASAGATVLEGSSCGVKTVSIELKITQAPSAAATVTFAASGTAAAGSDYSLSPAALVFPAGSSASQFLTLTIFEDGVVEAGELVSLEIAAVSTTGNAAKGLTNYRHLVSIQDDDYSPETAGSTPEVLLFVENFNTLGQGWTKTTGSGSPVEWRVGTPPLGMVGNFSAYVSRTDLPGNLYLYDQTTTGFTRFESPAFSAANATNLKLNFTYICHGESGYDYGTLWYSKNGGAWTPFGPAELTGQPLATTTSVPLPAAAANAASLRLAFRWDNDDLLGADPPFSFDNIELRASAGAPAAILTSVNAGAGRQLDLGANATVHFFDPASGKIMATVKNNGSYDYGCATLEVDRSTLSAGAPAAAFWNGSPANFLAAKTFRLVTENNAPPAGSTLTLSLFYTGAEIAAWEAATLQSKNSLKLVRVKNSPVSAVTPGNGGSGFDISVKNAALASFNGTHFKLSATFDGGGAGFGTGVPGTPPPSLAAGSGSGGDVAFGQNAEAAPTGGFITSVFPNPAGERLNVAFRQSEEEGEPVEIELQNQLGQVVKVEAEIQPGRAEILTGGLPQGAYLLVVRQGQQVEARRVVVGGN